ncbi:MAG TPA: VWA domain-containing protein [Silvibacterium sp.]|nr:VWA domain-containing protein [Silvibacterium sp.]
MFKKTRPAALLISLLSAAASFAQQNTTPQPPPLPTTDRAIRLDVVVTPKSGGQPVAGLEQQDFTLLDNKAPQPITSFRAFSGASTPVEVILLIDAVNTGFQTIAYERGQIDNFLRANGGKLAHPVKLAIFGDTGTQIQGSFSTDGNAIAAEFDKQTVALRAITRTAGFYGAEDRLDLSLRALAQLASAESTRPGRKLVLWVSPGWPIFSGPRVQLDGKQEQNLFNAIVETSTQLRQAGITLYNVNPLGSDENPLRTFYYEEYLKGVSKPSQVNAGNLALQVLATQSGGLVLNSSNDVTALLQQAFADANAWYEISFQSASTEPNEYHQIEVRVDKPGLIARTRQGYYAQP